MNRTLNMYGSQTLSSILPTEQVSIFTDTNLFYLVPTSWADHNQYSPRHSTVTSPETLSSASHCLSFHVIFLPILSSTVSHVAVHVLTTSSVWLSVSPRVLSVLTASNTCSFVFCSVHVILITWRQFHISNTSSRSNISLLKCPWFTSVQCYTPHECFH